MSDKEPEHQSEAASDAGAVTTEAAEHWLYRLSPAQWLAAADNELLASQQAFLVKQHRTAVTHARRAAGMALNAVLALQFDERYGRSYMDHLKALSQDAAVSAELRDAATRLLSLPIQSQLVTLGPRGDAKQAEPAALILGYARQQLAIAVAKAEPPKP